MIQIKLGFCLHDDWAAARPDLLNELDRLGFDGVEIWAKGVELLGGDGLEEIADRHSFEIASLNPYFDFTTSEETLGRSLEVCEHYLQLCARVSCPRLRTFTSPLGCFASSDEASDEEWRRAVDGLRAVCDMATPQGVTAVMEVHFGAGQLYDTSEAALRLLRDVGRPGLTVNLELPLRGEDFAHSAESLGDVVTHVHASNWVGEWGNFTLLDQGVVDYEAFLSILASHGFDGYVSIEHAKADPIGYARHNAEYLRRVFERMAA